MPPTRTEYFGRHIAQTTHCTDAPWLVEFRAEDPKVPIKPLHKMSKQQILKQILPNSFRPDHQFDGLPWQHVMIFVPEKSRSEGNGRPPE